MAEEKMVIPGSFLSYEEEFMAGKNTFEDDGKVYSSDVGILEKDKESHEANVRKFSKTGEVMHKGCIVYALVSSVKPRAALVEIYKAEFNGEERVVNMRGAALPVSNIANSYVKSPNDMFRAGDIIKARIAEVSPYGVDLETKAPDLGVIKAYGKKSRKPLVLVDNRLRDPVSGATENRKVSTEYILR